MEDRTIVRGLEKGEEEVVCSLSRRIFDEFVGGDFPREGVEEFYRYADPEAMRERIRNGGAVFVAVEGDRILGMIEIRGAGHVAELFVEERGRGLGRRLFDRARRHCLERADGSLTMTVNSSLFAVPIYEKLGFSALGPATTTNGITYVPMAMELERV